MVDFDRTNYKDVNVIIWRDKEGEHTLDAKGMMRIEAVDYCDNLLEMKEVLFACAYLVSGNRI